MADSEDIQGRLEIGARVTWKEIVGEESERQACLPSLCFHSSCRQNLTRKRETSVTGSSVPTGFGQGSRHCFSASQLFTAI